MFELSFRIGLFVAVLGGLLFALSFLPHQLPVEVVTAIQYFIVSVNIFSYWLPMQTFASVLIASIAFWTLMAFWDIGSWLMARITR